jgi:hypothetical protein
MAWKIRSTGIRRCLSTLGVSLAFATALSLASSPAAAAPARAKGRPGATAAVAARPARTGRAGAASVSAASATPAPVQAKAGSKPKPPAAAAPPAPTKPATEPAPPTPAEAAVAAAPGATPASDVVKTEEARAGEKTYTFGAQEVEGRLKSPQILYFLRRVRAQFDPAPLGHRSFLLELADTRRHPALR